MIHKNRNFWYDRWIVLKFLQEFLDTVLLKVDMDSLLCEDEAWTRQTGITAQECCNF
jgi:hypothetical protein